MNRARFFPAFIRRLPPGAALLSLCLALSAALPADTAAQATVPTSSLPDTAAPPDPLTLGNAFYDKGDYARASEQYRIVTRDSTSGLRRAFAWFNLGNCHVQTGSYHRAIVSYRRAVEEAPAFSRGYQLLGDVYYTIGATGEAVAAYTRLLELEEGSVRAQQMLGECALRGGDVTEALRRFEAALKTDPDMPEIHLAMAEAYARIRDYGAAQKVLEEALLRLPKPLAAGYFYLGQLYELDGNLRKAVRAYEEGLLLEPRHAEYYLRIAGIHEQAGDDFLALLILEQGVNAGIARPEFSLRRGGIFFRQGRYEPALREYRRAHALGSPYGRTGVENVAAAWFNAGKKKEAEAAMASLAEAP
jgi:tetratricopeptide (TPR) repeat protein